MTKHECIGCKKQIDTEWFFCPLCGEATKTLNRVRNNGPVYFE